MTDFKETETAAPLALDPDALQQLFEKAERSVSEEGLPSVQIALAYRGEIIAFETFGEATHAALYPIFSATKAMTAALTWLSIQSGDLDIDRPVSDWIPEFAGGEKSAVRVHHLLTHTGGFPNAPFRPTDYWDPDRKRARFKQWRLDWPPGTAFTYHPSSSFWVLAEILEIIHKQTFSSMIQDRIAEPLSLTDLWVGCPEHQQHRIVDISYVGDGPSEADYAARNLSPPPITEVTEEAITRFNTAETRQVPIPGGGGYTSAATLALFYQGLLGFNQNSGHFLKTPWREATLLEARRVRTEGLKDPFLGIDVLRGLGIVIAGETNRHLRGFGHLNSPEAFGHNGAGGQIAWADPETGISFAYLTNGHDRNPFRQGSRGVSLSNKAAVCLK